MKSLSGILSHAMHIRTIDDNFHSSLLDWQYTRVVKILFITEFEVSALGLPSNLWCQDAGSILLLLVLDRWRLQKLWIWSHQPLFLLLRKFHQGTSLPYRYWNMKSVVVEEGSMCVTYNRVYDIMPQCTILEFSKHSQSMIAYNIFTVFQFKSELPIPFTHILGSRTKRQRQKANTNKCSPQPQNPNPKHKSQWHFIHWRFVCVIMTRYHIVGMVLKKRCD